MASAEKDDPFKGKRFSIVFASEEHELSHWRHGVVRKIKSKDFEHVQFGQIKLGHRPERDCKCGQITVTALPKRLDDTYIGERHIDCAPFTPDKKEQYVCAQYAPTVMGCYMKKLSIACNITTAKMRAKMCAYQTAKGFPDDKKLLYCLFPRTRDGTVIVPIDVVPQLLPEYQDSIHICLFLENLKNQAMRMLPELPIPDRVRYHIFEGRLAFINSIFAGTHSNQIKNMRLLQSQVKRIQINNDNMVTEKDELRLQVAYMDSMLRKMAISLVRSLDETHFLRQCVAHQARKWKNIETPPDGADEEDQSDLCMCLAEPNADVFFDMFPEQSLMYDRDIFREHRHSNVCTRDQIASCKHGEPFAKPRPDLEYRMFDNGTSDTNKRKRKRNRSGKNKHRQRKRQKKKAKKKKKKKKKKEEHATKTPTPVV